MADPAVGNLATATPLKLVEEKIFAEIPFAILIFAALTFANLFFTVFFHCHVSSVKCAFAIVFFADFFR